MAIHVQDLGKAYRIYETPAQRLLELLTRRPRHRAFTALTDVSFDLPSGEAFGIIGENGAGKSTLMKILAGVVEPTSGVVSIEGRAAAILELGSGFHPEFTGRQNIVLNAAMLGLSEREVRERTPEILAFSELGDAVDQPVKTYSTGMGMRLGFAIATHVDPDILIIDEALSVGDGYFQKKCFNRMVEFLDAGKTLIFCSHAMYYVTALCQRALWLRDGRIAGLGPVAQVVQEYEHFLMVKGRVQAEAQSSDQAADRASELGEADGGTGGGVREAEASDIASGGPSATGGPARITGVRQLSGTEDSEGGHAYRHGDPLRLEISWQSRDPELEYHLGVSVNRLDEVVVLTIATHLDDLPPIRGTGSFRAELEIAKLPMLQGEFNLNIFLLDETGLHIFDREVVQGAIRIVSDSYRLGLVDAEHRWSLPE